MWKSALDGMRTAVASPLSGQDDHVAADSPAYRHVRKLWQSDMKVPLSIGVILLLLVAANVLALALVTGMLPLEAVMPTRAPEERAERRPPPPSTGLGAVQVLGSPAAPRQEALLEMPESPGSGSGIGSGSGPDHECDGYLRALLVAHEITAGVAVLSFLATMTAVMFGLFVLGRYVKPRPPKYWKNRRYYNVFQDSYHSEIDVTAEVGYAVQRLLDRTTDPRAMGKGRDGAWATHTGFKVVRVTRIESGKQWTRYKQIRRNVPQVNEELRALAPEANRILDGVKASHCQDHHVASFLKSLLLDASRNEHILFHGSPGKGARDKVTHRVLFATEEAAPVHAVKHAGFDDRLGSVRGMYGSGTYFADMASKADQYAGQYNLPEHPGGSVGEQATMFLSRVVLGTPYLTNQSLEQLRRPPCHLGHFDLSLSWSDEVHIGRQWRDKNVAFQNCEHLRFDSVIGDHMIEDSYKMYREYVVYQKQCYPEFCVTYERVNEAPETHARRQLT